ncbi:MAG: hypothetical protein HUU13_13510 [Burkholderiaceae bacterium]|nr:hypothetical protein [Burkholderiaceae bacterium]
MAPGSAETIVPPEGWRVQSPLGVLKTNTGVRLARLEDVHAWLMQRDGMSSASAVARVFGAFAADTNSAMGMEHGAEKVRESLHILDLSHDAEPVRGWAARHFLREVAELIPYVPHHRFDRGTAAALMYALGLIAGEIWAPHDVEIDLNDRLEGYCAEGYFPTVVKAREILGRFAVPFAAAHALWGWGTVAEVAAVPAVPLADWPALVAYRKANRGSDWGIGNQIAVAAAECERRMEGRINQKSSVQEGMAKELGLKNRQALAKIFNAARMRANKAAPATPVTKVKDGLKAA